MEETGKQRIYNCFFDIRTVCPQHFLLSQERLASGEQAANFGKASIRELFLLKVNVHYLNHGSYGAAFRCTIKPTSPHNLLLLALETVLVACMHSVTRHRALLLLII